MLEELTIGAATNASDGDTVTARGGRQGDTFVSDFHGKYFSQAKSGRLFFGSTAAAGTTPPVSSATAATFTLLNPLGSGVNAELISWDAGLTAATTVVGSLLLGIGTSLLINPTGQTALTMRCGLLGSAQPVCRLLSVATIVACTDFFVISSVDAVTSTAAARLGCDFDGKIILPPASLVHVCGSAAQVSAFTQTMVWAETPV